MTYQIQSKPDASCVLEDGSVAHPRATLKGAHGGAAHIIEDEGSLVLVVKGEGARCEVSPLWPPEAQYAMLRLHVGPATDEVDADLENRFTYHPPAGPTQVRKYEVIRAAIKKEAYRVRELCPAGRERSLAYTKLEEAVFWANAAIARADWGPEITADDLASNAGVSIDGGGNGS